MYLLQAGEWFFNFILLLILEWKQEKQASVVSLDFFHCCMNIYVQKLMEHAEFPWGK